MKVIARIADSGMLDSVVITQEEKVVAKLGSPPSPRVHRLPFCSVEGPPFSIGCCPPTVRVVEPVCRLADRVG